jgi:hypothetical protein
LTVLSWKFLMLLTGFSHDDDLTYEYADEVPTAYIQDNTASYSVAARDAGGAAGDGVGRGSGASSLVCGIGILGGGFAGTDCSVGFLKQGPALTADLTYSLAEAKGSAGYAVG